MDLQAVEQLSFDEAAKGYDAIIAASGYESRARHVAELMERMGTLATTKLVLGFAEHQEEHARPKNDATFARLGFEPVICRGGSDEEIVGVLTNLIQGLEGIDEAKILVDITSMTRTWYGAIIRVLSTSTRERKLIVEFCYAAAEFVSPLPDYPPNRVAAPVAGFAGNTLPDKPTALVLGLGYDKDRALGLKDHLDPQLTILFYADPANDPRYVQEVLRVNSRLINEVTEECLITYRFPDCEGTFHLLESVCNGLSHDWRVVICSLGPKIFGLCCFLVASRLTDMSIWRVSADAHQAPSDHKACGIPTLLRTRWG